MGTSAQPDPLDAAWESARSIPSGGTKDPLDAAWDAQQQARPRLRQIASPVAESTRQTGGVRPGNNATVPEPFKSVADFLINPALENPLTTIGAFALPPVGLAMAGMGAKRIVDYGAQKAAEMTLPADTRAFAEADPNRIQGREAATLAGAFALAPLIHGGVKALKRAPVIDAPPAPTTEAPAGSPLRVPASEAPARLAQAVQPQAIDAPVTTGAARDLIAQLDAVLNANKVEPGAPKPATAEAFPEGYSTTGKIRRPGTAAVVGDPLDVAWDQAHRMTAEAPRRSLVMDPEKTGVMAQTMLDVGKQRAAELERAGPKPAPSAGPDIQPAMDREGNSATFGRDLNEPGRVPVDAPKVAAPRGSEPSGVIQTPEGVVSVGPREIPSAAGRAQRPTLPLTDEAFAPAEPIAPKGPKPKGEWKDLSETPDDVLQAESQRIKELHATEEAGVAFKDTPEWQQWLDLPDKEKLGRSGRTTDSHGNKIKRQQEDLPDAWEAGGEDLAKKRQMLADYNKRTLVRSAEVNRAAAIDAELGRRSASMESPPELPPPDEAGAMPPPAEGGGSALPAVEGTGEAKTRGLSSGVNEKAVAEKLTTSLGDLPEYSTVNMKDQAARATKLLAENPELAHRVARGEAPPPADLLPESVFVAVEKHAIANGDVGTLRELASGGLTEQATTMGQRIRTLAERDPESPVAAMQKVVEARTKGAKNAKGATAEAVRDLQQHITEAAKMDPPAWKAFIDSLRC